MAVTVFSNFAKHDRKARDGDLVWQVIQLLYVLDQFLIIQTISYEYYNSVILLQPI